MGRVDGLKAVVTGSGGGMGGAIAIRLAEEGADVVLNDRVADRAGRFEADIRALGRDAVTVVANVTRREGAQAVVGAALERWGRVDILMNVVGGSQGPTFKRARLLELDKADFMEAFNINVGSVFVCCHEIVPHMLERGKGVVINMASIGAREYRLPEPVMSVYNMTKASVMHLTRSMAREWAPAVRVNCINAGHFITPRRARTEAPERRQRSLDEILVGRFGEPADIAAAAVYIASDAGAFFNGAFLDLHRGT